MVSEKDLRNSLQNYFRSEDLAKMADVIFSETLSVDDFNNRNLNAFIIHKNKDYKVAIILLPTDDPAPISASKTTG